MVNKKTWLLPYIGLIAGAVLVIFWFSLHSGTSSNLESEHVKRILDRVAHTAGITHPDLHYLQVLYPYDHDNLGNLLVRKLAHMTEYAVFGFLCAFGFASARHRKRALLLMLAAGPLVATIDEKFVQLYLSTGRTSSWRDVVLDSCGYLTGVAISLLLRRIILSVRRARSARGG